MLERYDRYILHIHKSLTTHALSYDHSVCLTYHIIPFYNITRHFHIKKQILMNMESGTSREHGFNDMDAHSQKK
jgi:hypothetical protein